MTQQPSANKDGAPWSGRAALGAGWGQFRGRAGDSHAHRHPALQLALGDGQPVCAEVAQETAQAPGLLIASGVAHRLRPGPVWLLYVERESDAGRRLAAACANGLRRLQPQECAQLRALWQAPTSDAARLERLVAALSGAPAAARPQRPSTQRLRALIAALPAQPAALWTLPALASAAALSPSRFAHAFREHTGMAVRPYLRWLRLARALEAAGRGQALTTAALDAGFADAAHFSRTMRHHFGVTPSSILGALRET